MYILTRQEGGSNPLNSLGRPLAENKASLSETCRVTTGEVIVLLVNIAAILSDTIALKLQCCVCLSTVCNVSTMAKR